MEEYIRQALEIVKAQAGFRTMNEEELNSMLRSISATIKQLTPVDDLAEGSSALLPAAPGKGVGLKSVSCHECGKQFKVLTKKHIMQHGLTPEEYREKWGYDKNAPLVCKKLQKERSKKMKDMRLWEKRKKSGEQED